MMFGVVFDDVRWYLMSSTILTSTPVNRSKLIKADQSRLTPVKAVASQSRSTKPVTAGQTRSKPVKAGQTVKVCAVVKQKVKRQYSTYR